MAAPTENKVWAATIGGGAGVTISTFLCWVLGVLVWGAPADASKATDAVAAVPGPVSAILILGLTVGATFVAGWRAKHTPRAPEPIPPAVSPPVVPAPVEPVEPDPPPVA